jgi:hypothetical protein
MAIKLGGVFRLVKINSDDEKLATARNPAQLSLESRMARFSTRSKECPGRKMLSKLYDGSLDARCQIQTATHRAERENTEPELVKVWGPLASFRHVKDCRPVLRPDWKS